MRDTDFLDPHVTQVIKRAVIDAATSGDNTIVAAVAAIAGTGGSVPQPARKIRVTSLFLVMTGTAVTIRFESGAGGTALTGQMTPSQGGGLVLPHNPYGWFETVAGDLLNMELGGAQSVDGALTYIEV